MPADVIDHIHSLADAQAADPGLVFSDHNNIPEQIGDGINDDDSDEDDDDDDYSDGSDDDDDDDDLFYDDDDCADDRGAGDDDDDDDVAGDDDYEVYPPNDGMDAAADNDNGSDGAGDAGAAPRLDAPPAYNTRARTGVDRAEPRTNSTTPAENTGVDTPAENTGVDNTGVDRHPEENTGVQAPAAAAPVVETVTEDDDADETDANDPPRRSSRPRQPRVILDPTFSGKAHADRTLEPVAEADDEDDDGDWVPGQLHPTVRVVDWVTGQIHSVVQVSDPGDGGGPSLATPQVSMKRGIKMFGDEAKEAVEKEMRQLHDR
jgi:hypothetical protein